MLILILVFLITLSCTVDPAPVKIQAASHEEAVLMSETWEDAEQVDMVTNGFIIQQDPPAFMVRVDIYKAEYSEGPAKIWLGLEHTTTDNLYDFVQPAIHVLPDGQPVLFKQMKVDANTVQLLVSFGEVGTAPVVNELLLEDLEWMVEKWIYANAGRHSSIRLGLFTKR